MMALLTGPGRRGPAVDGGRGGTRRVVLSGGKVVYCRQYLRGGLMRHLTSDLYLIRPERPLRELVVAEAARAAGCSVPAALACAIEEAGPCYRGWIVTEEVPAATSFVDVLFAAGPQDRGRWLDAVRTEVEKLHAAGIRHVDLNGENILVPGGGRPVIIDLDRAMIGPPVSPKRRLDAYQRLRRSLVKIATARGVSLESLEWARLSPVGIR